MGLLHATDWIASWIGSPAPSGRAFRRGARPCPHLRRYFHALASPTQALLHVAALGCVEPRINGRPVTEDVLIPGWMDPVTRIPYRAYDVTPLVHPGDNVVAAILADGWYAGHRALDGRRPSREPLLCMQLEIDAADGSRVTIGTDARWEARDGPIRASDLLMGEEHDARDELSGWDEPVGSACGPEEGWTPVALHPAPRARLVANPAPPVRRTEELAPRAVWRLPDGAQGIDLGRNISGHVRMEVAAPRGTRITLRHAEVLDRQGHLYVEPLRLARATDVYVTSGEPEETWEPRFTTHGFRYVGVVGLPVGATCRVRGVAVHTDMEATATFSCSNPMLRRLWENVRATLRSNALEVPTDCPQRDERLGWTGDALLAAPVAALAFDQRAFLRKWLADLEAAQSPDGSVPDVAPPHELVKGGHSGWGDAIVGVPHVLLQVYGDLRTADRMFPAIERWLAYCWAQSRYGLRQETHGDWLAPEETPRALVATACFARSAAQAAELAAATGRDAAATSFGAMRLQIQRAFAAAYLDPDGLLRRPTQTATAVALAGDLLPQGSRAGVARQLATAVRARGGIATGFVGTSVLLQALADNGHRDMAYELLEGDRAPSWGYAIARGATTLWERWDSIRPDGSFADPRMNSFNHPAFASVGAFLLSHVAGMVPLAPGFARVRITPVPAGTVTWARAGIHTVLGRVSVAWSAEAGRLSVEVTVPPGAEAELRLPRSPDDPSLGDRGIQPITQAGHETDGRGGTICLQSGTHGIEVPLPPSGKMGPP